jgi:hypothetical protein
MKCLYIEWLDHVSSPDMSWTTNEDSTVRGPALNKSVGWLREETDDYLILIANTSDTGSHFGEMLILKGCIVKKKVLRGV